MLSARRRENRFKPSSGRLAGVRGEGRLSKVSGAGERAFLSSSDYSAFASVISSSKWINTCFPLSREWYSVGLKLGCRKSSGVKNFNQMWQKAPDARSGRGVQSTEAIPSLLEIPDLSSPWSHLPHASVICCAVQEPGDVPLPSSCQGGKGKVTASTIFFELRC
ncbi:EEF1A lysine methyltransferase 2 [Grus japonensis]|uniref:EEF1A lysine methyltransferase 2 n=1 Tax=Grus japonensis TaxID=30415 RepID=A0ABC9X2N8_GRUJA